MAGYLMGAIFTGRSGPRRLQLQMLRFLNDCLSRNSLLPWQLVQDRQHLLQAFLLPVCEKACRSVVLEVSTETPTRLEAEASDTAVLMALFLAQEARLYWYARDALDIHWSLLLACWSCVAAWYQTRRPLYADAIQCCQALVEQLLSRHHDTADFCWETCSLLAEPGGQPLLQKPPPQAVADRLLRALTVSPVTTTKGPTSGTPGLPPKAVESEDEGPSDPVITWRACLPAMRLALLLGRCPAEVASERIHDSNLGPSVLAMLGQPALQRASESTKRLASGLMTLLMSSAGKLNAEAALEQLPALLELLSSSDSVGTAVVGIVANVAQRYPVEVGSLPLILVLLLLRKKSATRL